MESQSTSRRSFIDKRRKSLTLTNIFIDKGDEVDGEWVSTNGKPSTMKMYLDSLIREKDEWKEMLRERKIKCKESEEKYKSEVLVIDKEEVKNYLSPEDKLFVEDKPNYLEIVLSAQKYVNAINYLNTFKSDLVKYYNQVCDEIALNNKFLIDKMCADDLCDICNTENCEVSEHKFIVET